MAWAALDELADDRPAHRKFAPRRPSHELLAENVRGIAQAKGVSFVFLACVAGISTERLLAIFSGDFDPDLDVINKLADGLGVALSDLFADTDPEHN
jgi:transcriptional regulator with XRE-family HTH domain